LESKIEITVNIHDGKITMEELFYYQTALVVHHRFPHSQFLSKVTMKV
jgi:hypothetical protein